MSSSLPAQESTLLLVLNELRRTNERLEAHEAQIATLLQQQQGATAVAAPIAPRLPCDQLRLNRRLVIACYMHDYQEVVRLLDQGADLNAQVYFGDEIWKDGSDWKVACDADTRDDSPFSDGDYDPPYGFYTPLLAALEHLLKQFDHSFQVAKVLILLGADVKVRLEDKRTPIMLAAEHADELLFDLLCQKDAILNGVDIISKNSLHHACTRNLYGQHIYSQRCSSNRFQIVKKLLSAGLDVNALAPNDSNLHQQKDLYTPLMLAAMHGHLSIVNLLLQSNAEIDLVGGKHRTALHVACKACNDECISALVRGNANVNALNEIGTDDANKVIESTPLRMGCSDRLNPQTIKLLLDHGADVEACNADGNTALHLANGERWGSSYPNAAYPRTIALPAEVTHELLKARARPNKPNKDGETALHKSATYGDVDACKLLVSYGGDLYAKDKDGRTPIDCYGTKQSFIAMNIHPRTLTPALTAAQKAAHLLDLSGARHVHVASPLLIALLSSRWLIPPCVQDPSNAPQTVPGAGARRAVLSNRDLIKLVTVWL